MASSKNQEREAREARERLRRYNARQAVHTHQAKRRRRDNLFAVGGLIIVVALATATQIFYFNGGPGTPTPAPSSSAAPTAEANVGDVPSPDVSEYREWTGALTLNGVELGISLDGALAPQAVASFVTDAQSGYLDGKPCWRMVIDDTTGLIQCASTDAAGSSEDGYAFGPIENAPTDGIYTAGTIAMARTGSAYGNGHQFFIVFADSNLPGDDAGGYSVIGHVTSGMDKLISDIVAGGITPSETSPSDGAPTIPTNITKVTVQ